MKRRGQWPGVIENYGILWDLPRQGIHFCSDGQDDRGRSPDCDYMCRIRTMSMSQSHEDTPITLCASASRALRARRPRKKINYSSRPRAKGATACVLCGVWGVVVGGCVVCVRGACCVGWCVVCVWCEVCGGVWYSSRVWWCVVVVW